MKFYKSTAGCGYGEYAIVTPIRKNKNGIDYLCLYTNEDSYHPIHKVDQIIEDLENYYVEEISEKDYEYEFSFINTFLFKFFKENFSFENS